MKLFTLIAFVLTFWPIILDCSVSGRNAFLPTFVFYTMTYSVVDAFTTRTAVLQVLPPPAHMAHHNNGGQSGGWADSTVSIWTGPQVHPVRAAFSTGHASLDLAHQYFQTAWSSVCHRWRAGSIHLVDAVVTLTMYLLYSIAVGIVLLSKATVERPVAVVQSQRKHTFVSSITPIEGSPDCNVHGPVTWKHLSINTFTLEGRLVVSSGLSISDRPVEWKVLFHPHQYYRPSGSATESSNRNAQLDVANRYLLKMLLRGVTAYHPWSWYTPGIMVKVPKEVVKEPHPTRKQTCVQSISWIGSAPKSDSNGHTIERRKIVACTVRKPTFAPSIPHIGCPPKPLIPKLVLPRKPCHSAPWIQKFTLEGRVLLYAEPVKWVVRFDPYSGRHITRHGGDSSTREREFIDGHLLNILLFGGITQPLSVVSIPAILLDTPGEMVKESNKLAITSESLDITGTTSGLSPSTLRTPHVSTITDCRLPSIDACAAFFELDGSANPEELAARDLLEERSSAETTCGAVPANVGENAEESTSSNHTSLISQRIGWFDPTSDPLLREQRPAVLPELHSVLPAFEERALQRHTQNTWESARTEVREQHKVENATVEEDVQQEEVHQRRKRRGGKRNAAWKNKRRQEKEDRDRDRDRNPEAGPSGLR